MAEEPKPPTYFFETVAQNKDSYNAIDVESVKRMLSQQRKIFRDQGSKKEFFSILGSSNFDSIYNSIDRELKKAKDKNKRIKEELSNKKEDKRKIYKNTEKNIAEIFKMKQEIEAKRKDLKRLTSESNALQNKQQKQINDINTNNKYNISQLIDEYQCKNILNQQNKTLQSLINDTEKHKSMISTQKSINIELNKNFEELSKKHETYKDYLTMQQNQNLLKQNENSSQLIQFQQHLESIKRLLSIKKCQIQSNELMIKFEASSKEIYVIQIAMEPYQINENDECISYSIQSVQITNNNTKFNEITDYILSKFKPQNDNNNNNGGIFVDIPVITVKRIVIEILLTLRKLEGRYVDIRRLYGIYGSNDKQDMLPWLPENAQLVFKFTFKQKIDDNNDDEKGDGMITIGIPLVISMSWNYPQYQFITDNEVITVEHYNCNLGENHNKMNTLEIEEKWNNILQETVNSVHGQFQNDIVSFVGFIHDRLKRFADTNQ